MVEPVVGPVTDPVAGNSKGAAACPTPIPSTLNNRNLRPEEMFDYASFLWNQPITLSLSDLSFGEATMGIGSSLASGQQDLDGTEQSLTHESRNHQLIAHFQHAQAPPILAHIETASRWKLMRDLLFSMASTAPMVHHAILAFSSLQLQRKHGQPVPAIHTFYARSQEEISYSFLEHDDDEIEIIGAETQHLLAALFLLSYIDLVTDRANSAHVNLRKAFGVVSHLDQGKLDAAEKILISWIRLLDARAVSAGGDGLFLRDENELHDSNSRSLSPSDKDVEAVVSDLLLKPSLGFFQRTQSFMGRITKIDQWHRSRGTVEDESDVMLIAAQIRADNHKLYRHRHPLVDLAVTGSLEAPMLAQHLAERITQSSRMALASYHATFIHLHRVAYRHLPRTKDVCTAISVIRQMTHSMVENQAIDDTLPVNMLWPLLMWGSEEEDPEERVWILSTIRNMSNEVSNAAITADVLEKVWQRQDQAGQRVDIRTVMHDTFNSCFAIF